MAYVAGAALAVAMSFVFVMVRKSPQTRRASMTRRQVGPGHHLPRWLRYGLQALASIAWLWIVAQTFFGGNGDGDVAHDLPVDLWLGRRWRSSAR